MPDGLLGDDGWPVHRNVGYLDAAVVVSNSTAVPEGSQVHRPGLQRVNLELDLFSARRRAAQHPPFSPAWDAAMAEVEDLERALWQPDGHSDDSATQPTYAREASNT